MKRAMVYRVEPVLFDRMQGNTPEEGTLVQIQPNKPGRPRNGTMGMVYCQHVESGEFIGLLCKSSLVKTGKTAPLRDLAAEARDRASAQFRSRIRVI